MAPRSSHKVFHLRSRDIRRRIVHLLRSPLFWWITFWGNSSIFGGAAVFHLLEHGNNPNIHSFVDSLVWAVGTVTTVGGGAAQPVTLMGKIFSLFMMMGGAVFLWSYMGVFVGVLVDPELSAIQSEITEMEKTLKLGAPK